MKIQNTGVKAVQFYCLNMIINSNYISDNFSTYEQHLQLKFHDLKHYKLCCLITFFL